MKINGIFDFSKSVGNADGNCRYVVIHKGTTFPTLPTPQEGQLFYRTDLDTFYLYNGSTWNKSVNGITASDVPVADAGSAWTATQVEGVLDEIDGRLDTLESAGYDSKWNDVGGILGPKTTNGVIQYTTNGTVGTALGITVTGGANDALSIANSGTGNAIKVGTNSFLVNASGVGIGVAPSGEALTLGSGLVLGNASGTADGTLRWSGTDFEGRKGGAWSSLTSATTDAEGSDGQIQYNDGGTAFGGASQLVYNDATNRVGINTASPLSKLHITETTDAHIQLTNGANSMKLTVNASGDLVISNGTTDEFTLGQTSGLTVLGDVINLGDTTTTNDKIIYANNGDTNKPFLMYDESEDEWVISNDGTTTTSVGGGGTTAYTTSFTNATLSSGILTVTHSLGVQYVLSVVYDDSGKQIIPDEVTATSTSVCTIDLTSYGTISGTWNVRVL